MGTENVNSTETVLLIERVTCVLAALPILVIKYPTEATKGRKDLFCSVGSWNSSLSWWGRHCDNSLESGLLAAEPQGWKWGCAIAFKWLTSSSETLPPKFSANGISWGPIVQARKPMWRISQTLMTHMGWHRMISNTQSYPKRKLHNSDYYLTTFKFYKNNIYAWIFIEKFQKQS